MIFIVVRDIGEHDQREVSNEAVFDSENKAVEYIEEKGYIRLRPESDTFIHPKSEIYEYQGIYEIERWEIN